MKNVFKFFTLLITLFTLTIITAFRAEYNAFPEKIEWDSHFNAKPDYYSPYAALTATVWQYSYVSKIQRNDLTIDFKFVAGINPEKSWVKRKRIKDNDISKQLLNHEQGHVYINYLLLKQGEITIRNQKYTVNNYKKLIQTTANKVSKHFSDMQIRYDDETKHGSDLAEQGKWDKLIKKELDQYL